MEEQTGVGRTTKTREEIGLIRQETAVAWTRVKVVYVQRVNGMEKYFYG